MVSTVSVSQSKLQLEDAAHDPAGGGSEMWFCDVFNAWIKWNGERLKWVG